MRSRENRLNDNNVANAEMGLRVGLTSFDLRYELRTPGANDVKRGRLKPELQRPRRRLRLRSK